MSDDIHEESKDWSKPGQENVHADISPEMSAPYLNSQHNKQALSDITDRRHVQGKMAQNNEVEFEFNYNDPFDALSPTVKHENKSGLVDPDDGKGHADMQPPDHESSAIHRDSIDSNSNIDDTLSSSHPDRVDPSYTWSCLSRRRPLPRAHAGAIPNAHPQAHPQQEGAETPGAPMPGMWCGRGRFNFATASRAKPSTSSATSPAPDETMHAMTDIQPPVHSRTAYCQAYASPNVENAAVPGSVQQDTALAPAGDTQTLGNNSGAISGAADAVVQQTQQHKLQQPPAPEEPSRCAGVFKCRQGTHYGSVSTRPAATAPQQSTGANTRGLVTISSDKRPYNPITISPPCQPMCPPAPLSALERDPYDHRARETMRRGLASAPFAATFPPLAPRTSCFGYVNPPPGFVTQSATKPLNLNANNNTDGSHGGDILKPTLAVPASAQPQVNGVYMASPARPCIPLSPPPRYPPPPPMAPQHPQPPTETDAVKNPTAKTAADFESLLDAHNLAKVKRAHERYALKVKKALVVIDALTAKIASNGEKEGGGGGAIRYDDDGIIDIHGNDGKMIDTKRDEEKKDVEDEWELI